MKLTQEKVKELFDYRDGNLYWRGTGSGRVRKQVGCLNHHGYIVTTIKRQQYQIHRIIWLWHHGYFPEVFVDHINRDCSDNRIENLREASNQCNQRNTCNWKTNSSGVKGVWFDNQAGKWRAGIRALNHQATLGSFNFKYEAVLARLAAEQCLNWEGCDSSSPAYCYAKRKNLIK